LSEHEIVLVAKCFYKIAGISRNKFLVELLEEIKFRYSEFTPRQISDIFIVYAWTFQQSLPSIEDQNSPLHVFLPLLEEFKQPSVQEGLTVLQISQIISLILETPNFPIKTSLLENLSSALITKSLSYLENRALFENMGLR
jgi:hypothetical protein